MQKRDALAQALETIPADVQQAAQYYHDTVIAAMDAARAVADALETQVAASDWPLPTYGEMLFYV